MLRAAEVVDPHRLGNFQIPLAGKVNMHHCAAAAPVFRGSVGIHNARQRPLGHRPGQNAVGFAGFRVGLRQIAEGKEVVGAAAGLAGGLGKAMIELAMLGPGHMGHQPVKGRAAAFIPIQPVIDQIPQETAALGGAETVSSFQLPGAGIAGGGVSIAQESGQFPGGQQSRPDYRRAGGGIADLINLARRKAGGPIDITGIRHYFALLHSGKGPFLPGNDLLRPVLAVLHRHNRGPILQVVGGIGAVIAVGNKLLLNRRVGDKSNDQLAADGGTVRVLRFRGVEAQRPRDIRGVMLPTAPGHGETVPHQKAVAALQRFLRGQVGGIVEIAEGRAAAAVQDVKKETPPAPFRVDRLQKAEIGGELHQAGGVARRQFQVGYRGIGRMFRIHGKADQAVQLLVRADFAKGFALGKGLPGGYFQLGNGHCTPRAGILIERVADKERLPSAILALTIPFPNFLGAPVSHIQPN